MTYWRGVGMTFLVCIFLWVMLELGPTSLIYLSFAALAAPILMMVCLNAFTHMKGRRIPHKYTDSQLKMLARIPQKLEERKPLEYTSWKERNKR